MSTRSHREVLEETGMDPHAALEQFKRIRELARIVSPMAKAHVQLKIADGVYITLASVEKWIAELEEIVATR
jgi:hypothetical protein